MVRIKKLISLSILSSLIAMSSLSGIMTVREFTDIDMDECTMLFSPDHVRTDGLNESIRLGADKNGFFIRDSEDDIRVNSYDTDKLFEGHSLNEIALYGMTNKFKVSRFDNGEYKVEAASDLKGGGVAGATVGAYVAGGLVAGIGHGTIGLIAFFSGPAAPAVAGTLEFWFGPAIQGAAMAAAVAGGIAGGVATGPV